MATTMTAQTNPTPALPTARVKARGPGRSCLLFIATIGVAAAAGLPARAAHACGMIEYSGGDFMRRMPPRRAEPLLLAATAAANEGHLGRARSLALRVALSTAPDGLRARAWAIAGWASWRQGSREMALRSFRRARRLDPGATVIDRVLAQVSPSSSVADLKKVLPS